jgi:hypothetical protein
MKRIFFILILAAFSMGAKDNANNDDRKDKSIEGKTPVIECWPNGCCYEMNSKTIWSCEA